MERNETPRGPGWKGQNTNSGQQKEFAQRMKGDVEIAKSPSEKEEVNEQTPQHSEEKNSDEEVQIGQWED